MRSTPLYQTLVGAWPLEMHGEAERGEFTGRIQQYMEKAIHEAKINLSWLNPNPDYVDAMNSFVKETYRPQSAAKLTCSVNRCRDSFLRLFILDSSILWLKPS